MIYDRNSGFAPLQKRNYDRNLGFAPLQKENYDRNWAFTPLQKRNYERNSGLAPLRRGNYDCNSVMLSGKIVRVLTKLNFFLMLKRILDSLFIISPS